MDDEGMKSCLHMVKQWEKRGRWGGYEHERLMGNGYSKRIA